MRPFDSIRARHGSISPTVLQTIKSFSSAAAKIIEQDVPYLIRVAQSAAALNKAMARGQLGYEEQAELNKLIEEIS